LTRPAMQGRPAICRDVKAGSAFSCNEPAARPGMKCRALPGCLYR
jgi:hypothetical protein